jgi:hypothetical protein
MAVATRVPVPRRFRVFALVRRVALRLGWPSIVPALVSFSVLTSIGIADGGLFPRAWRLGTLALVSIAGAALLARRRVALSPLEWTAVGGLVLYALLTLVSGRWSGDWRLSALMTERALVYPAALLAALLVTERQTVPHLLAGVVAAVTAVCGYGLWIHYFRAPPLDPIEGKLLFQPLGYANAVGIVSVVAALVTVGLALASRSIKLRILALLPLVVFLPALYLSASRGSYLAGAAGLACLLHFSGRVSARIVDAVAVVAALALVAFVALVSVNPFSGQYRVQYWQVAWWDYRDHPVLGAGAGTFGDYWLHHRPVDVWVKTAHSLYIQALAELGPLGLAAILVAVLPPLLVLRNRRDPLLAGAGGAYLAFVLHAGVDWDWELPAVMVAGVFCGAAVLVYGRGSRRPLSVRGRALLGLPLAAVAVLACVRVKTGGGLPFGP